MNDNGFRARELDEISRAFVLTKLRRTASNVAVGLFGSAEGREAGEVNLKPSD